MTRPAPHHHNRDEEEFDPTITTQRVEYNVQNEGWFRNVWRPAMAWTYMAICIFDFILAPVAASVLITFYGSRIPPWTALTLASGGLIHVAFGTILGIAAWGRTREKQVEMGAPMLYPPSVGMGGMGGVPYPAPYPAPIRTTVTETTIVGNNGQPGKPPPPRPQKRE